MLIGCLGNKRFPSNSFYQTTFIKVKVIDVVITSGCFVTNLQYNVIYHSEACGINQYRGSYYGMMFSLVHTEFPPFTYKLSSLWFTW